MKKTITIGGHEVPMESSGDIPRMYRNTFQKDIIVSMGQFEQFLKKNGGNISMLELDQVEMFENLAWCFAKHADPEVPAIDEWLRQFEALDILYAIPALLEVWMAENKSTSQLKKKNAKLTDK